MTETGAERRGDHGVDGDGAIHRAPLPSGRFAGAQWVAPSSREPCGLPRQFLSPVNDDAVAALVAALTMQEDRDLPPEPASLPSRWALVGRRQAMQGITAGPTGGWGRQRRGTDG